MKRTINPPDQRTLAAVVRSDLTAFVHKVFNTIAPGDVYQPNWHIEAITYELGRCLAGENARLLITQPPRSLKSICTSVAYVAWALGHHPSLSFICVSYSQDLALDLARKFRQVVTSPWYQSLFPAMRLRRETEAQILTTAGGGRIATSIGGTLTGRGADVIIIDDPLKAEEALSETARKHVIHWYTTSLVTRLNDKKRGVTLVVMQRLHEDDLVGHLLRQGGWRHLDLPAIATEEHMVRVGPGAQEVHHREEGEALHPERESRETLEHIKADIGSLAFSAQYQQRPLPVEGNLIKREWLKRYHTPPDPTTHALIVQSWDVATTTRQTSDYSVGTTWAVLGKTYYLLDVWRGRVEYPELKRRVIALRAAHAAGTVLIESVGLGLSLVQDLCVDSPADFPYPIGIVPEGNKLTRMEAQSARIEAGQVLLPEDAPWLDDLLAELLAFPNARHDDQVDSVSQFLNWAMEHCQEADWNIY